MSTKGVLICAVAVDGLPSFVCDAKQLSALIEAGHQVVVICPEGTGKLIEEWRGNDSVLAVEYTELPSGTIKAFNNVLRSQLNWQTQDLLLIDDADCAITPGLIGEMQRDMYSFERHALGTPRMNVEGWVEFDEANLDFARSNLPTVTRMPFPPGPCTYFKGTQAHMFEGLDESFESLESALQEFAIKINAYGFDSVMLNHVFVPVNSHVEPCDLSDDNKDWRRLTTTYKYLEYVVAQFEWTGIDPIDRFISVAQGWEGRKPRLLFDLSNFPPVHCGLTEYLLGILECLHRSYKNKYDISVYANKDGAAFHHIERFCDNIIYREDKLGIYDVGLYAFQPTEVPRQIVTDRHCARMIYTMPDTILLRCFYIDNQNPYSAIEAVRLGLENSEGIVTISEFSKCDLLDYFQDDPIILNKPIRHMYIPTLFGDDVPEESSVLLRDVIPFDKYVLIAGNTFKHKALIEAVHALKDTPRNYVVIGIGSNDYLAPNVFGLQNGRIGYETIVELYKQCDAFIFPSVYEGYGLPIVNALKSRKTVIVNNNDLNHEVQEHLGEFASSMLFFDSFEELPALVEQAIVAPVRQADYQDTWDAFTKEFASFVDEVLEKPVDLDSLRLRHHQYAAHWQQENGAHRALTDYLTSGTTKLLIKEGLYSKVFRGHPARIDALHALKASLGMQLDEDE